VETQHTDVKMIKKVWVHTEDHESQSSSGGRMFGAKYSKQVISESRSMKLLQYLIIGMSFFMIPQVIFAEAKVSDSYNANELKHINYMLITKKACDLYVPEYFMTHMDAYKNWREKHNFIIQDIESSNAYVDELEKYRSELKFMTASQISELKIDCNNIAAELDEN